MARGSYTGLKAVGIVLVCALAGGAGSLVTARLTDYKQPTRHNIPVKRQSDPRAIMIDLRGLEESFEPTAQGIYENLKRAGTVGGGAVIGGALGLAGCGIVRRKRFKRQTIP